MSELAPSSYRSSWKAYVPASKVRDAAQARASYHRDREAHWKGEQLLAEEAYRESIQVREHEITGGTQMGVQADQEKANYLGTCKSKREQHRQAALDYEGWAAFLADMGGARVDMTESDAAFFGWGLIEGGDAE